MSINALSTEGAFFEVENINTQKSLSGYAAEEKEEREPEGLVSLKNTKYAVSVEYVCTAPHNNKKIVGDNKRYDGVGGHLFALAVEESVKNGHNGDVIGIANCQKTLDHYINKLGAHRGGGSHPFSFHIVDEASQNLLDKYTYEREE